MSNEKILEDAECDRFAMSDFQAPPEEKFTVWVWDYDASSERTVVKAFSAEVIGAGLGPYHGTLMGRPVMLWKGDVGIIYSASEVDAYASARRTLSGRVQYHEDEGKKAQALLDTLVYGTEAYDE